MTDGCAHITIAVITSPIVDATGSYPPAHLGIIFRRVELHVVFGCVAVWPIFINDDMTSCLGRSVASLAAFSACSLFIASLSF